GHLPGIPAADIVEKEGFELGDMQRRLLEKIEELTLYLIETDRQINRLQTENSHLVQRILKLEGAQNAGNHE
ncbi:MAG: hypothetical protein R3301_16790, partial [Saprospiraceae bacterium]|nr:hypothetical protein [Saprospiraceae bacterium]